jgi:hypothetical protein
MTEDFFMLQLKLRLFFLLSFFLFGFRSFASTTIDPRFILDQEAFLEFLKNPELKDFFFPTQARPGRCPFKAYNQDALIEQLKSLSQALRHSHCDTTAHDIAVNLDNMASVLKNAMIINRSVNKGNLSYQFTDISLASAKPSPPLVEPYTPKVVNAVEDQKYSMYLESTQVHGKELMRQLINATADPKCVEDLNHAGLVSVVADIAVHIGQMALFVPGQNGLSLGFGSLALAATLKVVSALLKSPYNWDLEKDRMHFLNLNCNFFDLRKILEEADFFDSQNEDRAAKSKKGKEYIEVFDQKIEEVYAARESFHKHVLEIQTHFMRERIDIKKLDLYRLVLQAESLLHLDLNQDEEVRYILSKGMAKLSVKIIPLLLEDDDCDKPCIEYLRELLKTFMEDLKTIDALELKDLKSNYTAPLSVYFKDLHEGLIKIIKIPLQDFAKLRVSDTENNIQVLERGERVYESLLQELQDRREQLVRRVLLHQEKMRKSVFSSFENGAHNDFDILKEYAESQKVILGETGWKFLRFLKRSTDRHLREFSKIYEIWSEKYGQHQDTLSSFDMGWACRDANQMRVKWNSAFYALSLTNDFYETNQGIFSTKYKMWKIYFHFLPFRKTEYFKIYKNMLAMEKAHSVLTGKSAFTEKDVKQTYSSRYSNLGSLILKLEALKMSRESVDAFFKEKNCLQYL